MTWQTASNRFREGLPRSLNTQDIRRVLFLNPLLHIPPSSDHPFTLHFPPSHPPLFHPSLHTFQHCRKGSQHRAPHLNWKHPLLPVLHPPSSTLHPPPRSSPTILPGGPTYCEVCWGGSLTSVCVSVSVCRMKVWKQWSFSWARTIKGATATATAARTATAAAATAATTTTTTTTTTATATAAAIAGGKCLCSTANECISYRAKQVQYM